MLNIFASLKEKVKSVFVNEKIIPKQHSTRSVETNNICNATKMLIPKDQAYLENEKEFKSFLYGRSFIGYVMKVVDGDTVEVNIKLNNEVVMVTFILYGINCPELKPPTIFDEEEQQKIIYEAKKSYDFLHDKIFNKFVVCNCLNFDCFGRLLADIYLPQIFEEDENIFAIIDNMESMSKTLIENNLATSLVK